MADSRDEEKLEKAAGWLREADGLLITAGAGMGVDSGLPDFHGQDGFWRAYPALQHRGLSFEDMANPAAFARHPELAWGCGRLVKRPRDVALMADKLPVSHEFTRAVAEKMPHPEDVLALRRILRQLTFVHLQPEPLVALQAGHYF
ncbi:MULTISPECIES: hypothetical protein [Paraburkholderia]|uniref:hypothetical protein n=1 Tax=Paraburkholderia TaxID=1822464 RepID=UPI0028A6FF67|nr:hypothetical protein [Paraburkholderia podalyriae]